MSSTISRTKIFSAIMGENKLPIPLTDETVTISNPTPAYGEGALDPNGNYEKWNTMVTITAKEGGGYHGSVNIYYKRLDLNIFTGTDALLSEEPFTPQMLIDALNRHHESLLILDDLKPIDLTGMSLQAGVISCIHLEAVDQSLGWLNDVWVPIAIGVPCEAPKLHHLLHCVMTQKKYWL